MARNPGRKSPQKSTATGEPIIGIAQFIETIQSLPEDMPHGDSRVWYRTQKEHWLGWLAEYDGPGAYGRKQANRDAKFAYNHIVCPQMLLWLIEAAGVPGKLVQDAKRAADGGTTLMQQSGAVRKCVPWSELVKALWPSSTAETLTTADKASIFEVWWTRWSGQKSGASLRHESGNE